MPSPRELSCHYTSAFETSYGNYVEARAMKKEHFRYQLGLLSDQMPGPRARVLDVGCAAGFLLEVGREYDWDVVGIELNPKAREAAAPEVRDLIRIGVLEDFAHEASSQRFDLITMFDLVEHVRNPRSLLAACLDELTPDGRLVVQIPCIDSLGARLLGRHWFHYAAPSHLSYFSERTFGTLARSVGFEVVRSMWTRKRLTLGYLRDQVTLQWWGRKIEALRFSRLDDLPIKLPMGERLMVLTRQMR